MRLESDESGTTDGPILDLFRNKTGAASQYIGNIRFIGKDDADNVLNFSQLRTYMADDATGSADSLLQIKGLRNSAEISVADIYSYRYYINPEQRSDVDTRIAGNGKTMLEVDAGLNMVGISGTPVSGGAILQVPDATISSYDNIRAVRSDGVAQQQMSNADCQGQLWLNDSSTSWTLLLPESGTKGQHFRFLSSDGDMTIGANGETVNGAGSDISRNTNFETYTVTCYAAGKWAVNNPA